MISRDFKGNEELEKRYGGGKDGKSDRRGSGGIIYSGGFAKISRKYREKVAKTVQNGLKWQKLSNFK